MSPMARVAGTVALLCAFASPGSSRADAVSGDQVASTLLEPFLKALREPDFERSAKATLPFVHPSLMNEARTDLAADLKRFSFKKAHENAGRYTSPVKVVREHRTGITSIGSAASSEAGVIVDYFVERRPETGGPPAPLRVFFPAGGGAPKIAYMGSL